MPRACWATFESNMLMGEGQRDSEDFYTRIVSVSSGELTITRYEWSIKRFRDGNVESIISAQAITELPDTPKYEEVGEVVHPQIEKIIQALLGS